MRPSVPMSEDRLHLEHAGACRTAFDHVPAACARVLLVGEDNPQSSRPEHALFPYPQGCAGNRLQDQILQLPRAQYLALWRTNLCNPTWSRRAAEGRSIHLLAHDVPWDVVVLLGRKVADVFAYMRDDGISFFDSFGHEVRYMSGPAIGTSRTFRIISLPHPSGRNLIWNQPGPAATARARLADVAPTLGWGRAHDALAGTK